MTEHTGDDLAPESRSRELAAKATPTYGWLTETEDLFEFDRETAAYIAFHDPSLITAYADVVEAARAQLTWSREPVWVTYEERAVMNAIARLDALAKDRG